MKKNKTSEITLIIGLILLGFSLGYNLLILEDATIITQVQLQAYSIDIQTITKDYHNWGNLISRERPYFYYTHLIESIGVILIILSKTNYRRKK